MAAFGFDGPPEAAPEVEFPAEAEADSPTGCKTGSREPTPRSGDRAVRRGDAQRIARVIALDVLRLREEFAHADRQLGPRLQNRGSRPGASVRFCW